MAQKKVEIKCKIVYRGSKYELILVDRAKVIKECAEKFLIDSGQAEITLEGVLKYKYEMKTRSQLAYYFAAVVPHIKDALENNGYKGLNIGHVDDFLRRKFLTVVVFNEITAQQIEFQKTLSGLDKDETIEFIDNCIVFAQQELNWYIPKPGEK